MMLVHDVRGRCWWESSASIAMPPTFRDILLPCDKVASDIGSVNEAKVWNWITPCGEKWHLLKCIYPCWRQWGSGWVFQQWQQQRERQAVFHMAMDSCHTMKWRAFLSACLYKLVDYNQGTVYRAEYWLHCVGNKGDNTGILQSLCQVGLVNAHGIRKNTVCKFVGTYWTMKRLKVKVSWFALLPEKRHGDPAMSGSQVARSGDSTPWSGDTWIPHQRKCSRCSP